MLLRLDLLVGPSASPLRLIDWISGVRGAGPSRPTFRCSIVLDGVRIESKVFGRAVDFPRSRRWQAATLAAVGRGYVFGTGGSGSPARRFRTSPARISANGAMSSPTLAFSRAAI
jgi:hypothetical protein